MAKRQGDYGIDDLESEFDYQSDAERKQKRRKKDLMEKERPGEVPLPGREERKKVFQEEHGRLHRSISRLRGMDAYSRHKEMINNYYLYYEGATKRLQRDTSKDRTDYDVLMENHKFLWDEASTSTAELSWETRLAKRYYDKLFKEYVIVDLSQFKKNRVAMRWRVEREVRAGKGQFQCANKTCNNYEDLTSWEVNFGYEEQGSRKNALVKVRLCPECSEKLNYNSTKRKAEKKKRKRERDEDQAGEEKGNEDIKKEDVDRTAMPPPSTIPAKEKPKTASEIWSAPVEEDVEKTIQEDIDDFINDLFD